MKDIDTVICTHGFWSHGASMLLIKQRLEAEYDYRVLLFNYPSVYGSLDENANSLSEFIDAQNLGAVHIVGHSLGGVVTLRMHATNADAPRGRIVCLGSPLTGSRAADFLGNQAWAEPILGRSLTAGVVNAAANEWASDVCARREIGIIAGSSPIGVGRLLAEFDEPNDGTVAVSETRLKGAKDHLVLNHSHTGMLMSREVADQTAAFLRRGEFLRDR